MNMHAGERHFAASRDGTVPLTFILLLVAVSAVSPFALNIFVPSMPAMRTVFGVDFTTVQLTLSLYFAGIAVAQLVIGPLSDRFGRRPVLLGGLGVFVAASVLCALATSIEVLIIGRVVQAAGGCAGLVLARAIVRDLFEREQAASMIGYVTMGMAVAPMVSPAIGGVIEVAQGWRATFVLVAVFGAAVLVLAAVRLPETHHRRVLGSPGELVRGWGSLVRSSSFWGYALVAGFASSCFYAFVSGAAYVTTEVMGRSPAEYGFYFPLMGVGYILGNFASARLVVRRGIRAMILAGNGVTLFGLVLMAALFAGGVGHPLSLFGPMVLVGVGNGLCLPSAMSGAINIRPDLAGAASGLTGTVQMGSGVLVSPLIGWLLDETVWPLVWVMMAGAVLACLSPLLIREERPRKGAPA